MLLSLKLDGLCPCGLRCGPGSGLHLLRLQNPGHAACLVGLPLLAGALRTVLVVCGEEPGIVSFSFLIRESLAAVCQVARGRGQ